MVKSSLIIKWSVIQMVIWIPDYFSLVFKWLSDFSELVVDCTRLYFNSGNIGLNMTGWTDYLNCSLPNHTQCYTLNILGFYLWVFITLIIGQCFLFFLARWVIGTGHLNNGWSEYQTKSPLFRFPLYNTYQTFCRIGWNLQTENDFQTLETNGGATMTSSPVITSAPGSSSFPKPI